MATYAGEALTNRKSAVGFFNVFTLVLSTIRVFLGQKHSFLFNI